jgi:hypothetical protein
VRSSPAAPGPVRATADRDRCCSISDSKPASSTPEPVLGDELERQVDREPERVVQAERVLGREPLVARARAPAR